MKIQLIRIAIMIAILQKVPIAWAETFDIDHFTKIRMDYAKRADFNPGWKFSDERQKITKLWDKGKIDDGMKLAKQWLAKHPVDAEMHLWYAFFLRKERDFQGYFRHTHFYQGLLASITGSGKGFSEQSPMKVISIHEQYYVLRALDAKLIQQSLITCKSGIPCDKMQSEIDGEKVTLYFDVSISMDYLNKMFPNREKRPPNKTDAGDS